MTIDDINKITVEMLNFSNKFCDLLLWTSKHNYCSRQQAIGVFLKKILLRFLVKYSKLFLSELKVKKNLTSTRSLTLFLFIDIISLNIPDLRDSRKVLKFYFFNHLLFGGEN